MNPTPRRKSAGIRQPGSVPGRCVAEHLDRPSRRGGSGPCTTAWASIRPRPSPENSGITCIVVSSTASALTGPVGHLRRARHRDRRGEHDVAGRDAVDVTIRPHEPHSSSTSESQASFSSSVEPNVGAPARRGSTAPRRRSGGTAWADRPSCPASARAMCQDKSNLRRPVRCDRAAGRSAPTTPTIDRSSPRSQPVVLRPAPQPRRRAGRSADLATLDRIAAAAVRPAIVTRHVARRTCHARPGAAPAVRDRPPITADPTERFAARTAGMTASEIRALFAVASRPEVVSLAGGMPYLAALPLESLAAEVAELVAEEGQVALQYGSGQGIPALREQICEVMALEGIDAHPDDVVVTVGSQMALDLVTRIFCDPGDVVLAEAPVLRRRARHLRRVPGAGRARRDGRRRAGPGGAARRCDRSRPPGGRGRSSCTRSRTSTTRPASRCPSSAGRRSLEICRRAGVAVLEDNPYGLLGFDGAPTRACASMDREA